MNDDDTTTQAEQSEQPQQDGVSTEAEQAEQPQTFSADYVTELRTEAAKHRSRSKSLASELVAAWAAVDGRLVDPTDLPVASVQPDDEGNYTRQAVTAAIDALLASKPHLGAARPAPLPQGARPEAEQVSLLGLLNRRP